MNEQRFFALIESQIPLLKAMGMEYEHYDGQQLRLTFPLESNINDKGTGFAGSLTAATTFCAWAVVKLLLKQKDLDFDLAVVTSNSEYKVPVTDDFRVESQLPSTESVDTFLDKLRSKGKASLPVSAVIKQGEADAVIYQGTYVAFPR